jgi:hypothetical protein
MCCGGGIRINCSVPGWCCVVGETALAADEAQPKLASPNYGVCTPTSPNASLPLPVLPSLLIYLITPPHTNNADMFMG